jgi:PilZ domain
VPIRTQVTCIANTHTSRGVIWNMSEGGIQVQLPELRKKAKVHLTFRLPVSETIIDVLGTVAWRSDRRHGIKFKYLGKQSADSVRHFVEEQKTGEFRGGG